MTKQEKLTKVLKAAIAEEMALAAAKQADGLSCYYSDIDEAKAKALQYAVDLINDPTYLRMQASYFEIEKQRDAA